MRFPAQCVLFDLDGTLIDTAPDLAGAANAVRAELDLPPLPLAQYRPAASGGARGLLRVALGIQPGDAEFMTHRQRFIAHYEQHLADGSGLFDGVETLLQNLEARGLRWGIVTNKVRALTDPLLEALQLHTRSACTIAGDDVEHPKPAPDSLYLACTRLGISSATAVYVGDDRRDIVAGRAAGMPTVAAGWGYLGDYPDPASWEPDVIIQTPAELLTLLQP